MDSKYEFTLFLQPKDIDVERRCYTIITGIIEGGNVGQVYLQNLAFVNLIIFVFPAICQYIDN